MSHSEGRLSRFASGKPFNPAIPMQVRVTPLSELREKTTAIREHGKRVSELLFGGPDSLVQTFEEKMAANFPPSSPQAGTFVIAKYLRLTEGLARLANDQSPQKGFDTVVYPFFGTDMVTAAAFCMNNGRLITVDREDLFDRPRVENNEKLLTKGISDGLYDRFINGFHLHTKNRGLTGYVTELAVLGVDFDSLDVTYEEATVGLGVDARMTKIGVELQGAKQIEHVNFSRVSLKTPLDLGRPQTQFFAGRVIDLLEASQSPLLLRKAGGDKPLPLYPLLPDGSVIFSDRVNERTLFEALRLPDTRLVSLRDQGVVTQLTALQEEVGLDISGYAKSLSIGFGYVDLLTQLSLYRLERSDTP